jgi:hypothetical protein
MIRRLAVLIVVGTLSAVGLPQIHGVPAGATSLSNTNTLPHPSGIPASATSLGPRGFGSAPQRFQFGTVRDGREHHARRIIIPVPVPLYSYGAYPYLYPYDYSGSVDMSTADYRTEPVTSPLTPPQIVVAPVQQPPQVIVIDNRGVRDATDEETQDAIATRKSAKKPKAEVKEEARLEAEDVGPMTVLVFRDGTRKEVKNYAIMGKELIELGSGSLHRFPIADIDLAATQKENDVRGLDFKLP